MGHTTLERLESLEKEIKSAYGFAGYPALRDAVQRALREPPPKGHPDKIMQHAALLRELSRLGEEEGNGLRAYVTGPLPQAWTGTAATSATVAATAIDNQMRRMVDTFDEGDRALRAYADAIESARELHPTGHARLEHAAHLLSTIDQLFGYDGAVMKEAHHEAMAGIAVLVRCARTVEAASHVASRTFAELASRARSGRITSKAITALDKLVIADAATSGPGAHDANLILTADASGRASANLDRLRADDQKHFAWLLGQCRSTQEQAYLLQALAAGYGVAEIDAFDHKIHAHGDDQVWLQQHLTPITEAAGPDPAHSRRPVEFGGREWTQGSAPTCVAMSTVMARAKVDPLYALQLTTGGYPDDPSFDSGDAFARRLHDEQHDVYDGGRNWLQDLFGTDGMTEGQARDVANEQVAPHTGARYDKVTVDSTGDRRNVLPEVEKAVDQGLPVTFTVQDGHGGHEMAIVGHQDGMLEVYNPWGYTVWVSEDDFVNNHMNVVGDGVPASVHAVNVPRR
ncbi:hypothetical protein HC028_21595 [Planosporangium flavigriseum]|uniref:Peptidoglycan-binding protein n=1 Tax=Planosporangium flavigriseum TaxID=373681 RepID=A0A8J3M2F1_9ACTN|nr:hypothetical protein [Planosporangium flavigriseum]NJC67075.1 hypothetical protein [Planosporangium flavigriseum]GIG75480.1 hypothetical protein Pfl04_38840 [Planosporangium flavigriseum]